MRPYNKSNQSIDQQTSQRSLPAQPLYKHFHPKKLNLSHPNHLNSMQSSSDHNCETPVIEEVDDDELRPMQHQPKASISSKPGSHLTYQMKVKPNKKEALYH